MAGITRRDLLLGSLAAGGGLWLLPGLGRLIPRARAADGAATPTDRHYVFCYFGGGWDVLLSLDPRDPAKFHAGNLADTRIQPGYDQLKTPPQQPLVTTGAGLTFGPYIGDLANHADKLAVVRGLSMDTLTHEVGRRRFLTGKPPSGLQARGSSAATWLASMLGEDDPIPNLACRVESYNMDQPSFATGLRVNGPADLLRALRPGSATLDPAVEQQIDALLAQTAACPDAAASPFRQAAEAGRLKAAEMLAGDLDAVFDFQAKTPEMAALRAHYGLADTGAATLGTPAAQAAIAARAIMGGVSRTVSIQLAGNLDTHYDDWQTDQGPNQKAGFDAVARLIEDLAGQEYQGTGSSWLDHTIIVGFSEFSRSPLLNDRGGRDHWLMNACFLCGGPIQGGQAIGASSDVGMAPQPIDLTTGVVSEAGEIVRPEHVIQALLWDLGLTNDPADLRVDPLKVLLKA